MIKMLQKLKDEPASAAVPSPVPMKKDDGLYEDVYSLDISSQRELPPLPPDRPVPGKQNKADPFRMSPLAAKESNFGRFLCALPYYLGHCSVQPFVSLFRAAAEEE